MLVGEKVKQGWEGVTVPLHPAMTWKEYLPSIWEVAVLEAPSV